jgi:ribosome biogenesis GTPase
LVGAVRSGGAIGQLGSKKPVFVRAGAGVKPEEGLVVSHFGLDVEVRFSGGDVRRVRLKRGVRGIVVGDRLRVGPRAPELLPRETVLERRDTQGRTRAIAANLDVLGITVSSHPPSPQGYLDRGIVAARAAGIVPFVVVNKCDLPAARELCTSASSTYAAPGEGRIDVFGVSARDSAGLDDIRAYLAEGRGGEERAEGRRGAFIGTSGVGKSSLLNALVPGLELDTGEINRMTRLGRHVTTRSTLHTLDDGGELIDTPGFRDFIPVALSPMDLAHHFAGFEEALAVGCRFRDCLHRDEPDCGVTARVDAGEISPERHQSYLRILGDLERAERDDRVRSRSRGSRS